MAGIGPSPEKHIVVIGGGLAGLSASYDLVRTGHRVTLLEAEPEYGGLARSFRLGSTHVEHFYHFICRADRDLIRLVRELGIENRLRWEQTRTAFFHQGKMYPFGTPIDLMRFAPVPWFQRLRFGFHILHSRNLSHWKALDGIPAKSWLVQNIGEKAYQVIWHPLLKVKFGEYYSEISAAWIWHRIWRIANSRRRIWGREIFGSLENGSKDLIDALVDRLRAHPSACLRSHTKVDAIRTQNQRVTGLIIGEEHLHCDAVLSTVALPILNRLLPTVHSKSFVSIRRIDYIGVVCMVLNMDRPFSSNFWLNIHDSRISFNGIIEQTNLNPILRSAGLNIIYVPFYLPVEEERYQRSDESLYAEYLSLLAIINPDFAESWVKEWRVFRTPYAQAICTTNFSDLVPAIRSPIQGLYVTDSTQFYPEDRTISAAIRQGRKAAQMIQGDS